MSFLTSQDVINIQTTAIRRTAQGLGIDLNDKTMLQIFDEISRTNDPLFNLLDAFVVAYRQYQNYHFYLDNDSTPGHLLPFQQDGLTAVMNNRDNTRNALLNALNERGF